MIELALRTSGPFTVSVLAWVSDNVVPWLALWLPARVSEAMASVASSVTVSAPT